MNAPFTREGLVPLLRTTRFGQVSEWHASVTSTNDAARRLAKQGAAEGSMAIAEVQSVGRGRQGRPWSSPPGGLWFSVVLRPPQGEMSFLSLAFAAAACRAIETVQERPALVHWPNDVLLSPTHRKCGGVLLESRHQPAGADGSVPPFDWIVAGIGLDACIDVRALDPEAQAVAESISDRDIRLPLLAHTLWEMEQAYDALLAGNTQAELTRARSVMRTLGKRVRITLADEDIEGQAEDLEPAGALRLRLDDGTRRTIWSCERCTILE